MSKTKRPSKPRPDFPLFPHATGRWCKKVRGKFVYFGKVAADPDGQAALVKWLDQRDDLLAGRTPRVAGVGLTVRDLANRFLMRQKSKVDSGELAVGTFANYHETCSRLVEAFGPNRLVADLDAGDFERLRGKLAAGKASATLVVKIQLVRVVFNYATTNLLVSGPIRYGSSFAKPSRKTLRLERAGKPLRMFEAAELRTIIAEAGTPMRAMVLLGINAGFGPSDVASLPDKALDLQAGWVTFPRPKTGTPRRCWLWPETVKAIREALDARPRPKTDAAGLVFVSPSGERLVRAKLGEPNGDGMPIMWETNAIGKTFGKLLRRLGLHRPGLGHYTLRHTFRTVADATLDFPAANAIMGHVDETMASVYRERIDDGRLRAVAEHVRTWLFGDKADSV